MRQFGAASLAAHIAITAGLIVWNRLARDVGEPDKQAVVEIITGHQVNPVGGAAGEPSNGQSQPAAPPSAPAPDVPATSPSPSSVAARPPPPPMPQADAAAPAPAQPAPKPLPPPSRPSPASPSSPAAPPPAGRSDIRLGGEAAQIGAEIEAGGVNVPATSEIGNVYPDYPLEAARRHESGVVGLRLVVGADGLVAQVDILRSSGSPSLDRSAVDRLRTWHFQPATRNGTPMTSVVEENINFALD